VLRAPPRAILAAAFGTPAAAAAAAGGPRGTAPSSAKWGTLTPAMAAAMFDRIDVLEALAQMRAGHLAAAREVDARAEADAAARAPAVLAAAALAADQRLSPPPPFEASQARELARAREEVAIGLEIDSPHSPMGVALRAGSLRALAWCARAVRHPVAFALDQAEQSLLIRAR
jgi:hypothetical protein